MKAFVPILLAASVTSAAAQGAGALHLNDAIVEALAQSPDLGAPEDAVAAADLGGREAAAPFGVRMSPNLSRTSQGAYDTRTVGFTVGKMLRTGTDMWVTGSSIDLNGLGGQYRDRGYSIGLSQPLNALMSRAMTAPLDAAKSATSSADRKLTAARQQLIVSVAEAYYAVVQAERLCDAAVRARDRARTLVEASDARVKAGLDTQLDVMRAQLLASQAEETVGDRNEGLTSAREHLNLILGRAAEAELVVADDPLPPPETVAVDEADAVDSTLAHRVEIQDSRARVEDAKRQVSVAHADMLPSLTFNVEYVERGFGSAVPSLFQPYNGWHFAVTSDYRLDRATRAAGLARSELAVRAAQRDAQAIEQRIAVEVRQATRAVVKADRHAAIEARARDIAMRQVELAEFRYERGLADNLTVVDAEAALAQAEASCIGAEIERHLARLRLQRATGALDPGRPPSL